MLTPILLIACLPLFEWWKNRPLVPHDYRGGQAMLVLDRDYTAVASRIMREAQKSIYLGILRIGGDPLPLPSFEGGQWPPRKSVNQLIWGLIAARRRGVLVRVKLDQPGFSALDLKSNLFVGALLQREGINVVYDSKNDALHAKFLIIDDTLSLVGAGNWCISSLDQNNDLAVLVRSASLARRLISYWENIPVATAPPNTVPLPHTVREALGNKLSLGQHLGPIERWPWIDIAGCSVAEDRRYLPHILSLIRCARSSIYIGQSELNYDNPGDGVCKIVETLRNAAGRGVDIRVILQDGTSNPWARMSNRDAVAVLHRYGIKAVLDDDKRCMHSKFIVIDRRYSIIGSTNWTPGAIDRGHEVSLIIDSEELAKRTIQYWESIFVESRCKMQ